MPYAEFQCTIDDPPGYRNYWTAEHADDLPDAAIDAIVGAARDKPDGPVAAVHRRLGRRDGARRRRALPAGRARTRASSSTRSRCGRTPPTTSRRSPGRAGFRELMAPYRTGGAYLNFIGDEGGDRVRAAFGASATPGWRG